MFTQVSSSTIAGGKPQTPNLKPLPFLAPLLPRIEAGLVEMAFLRVVGATLVVALVGIATSGTGGHKARPYDRFEAVFSESLLQNVAPAARRQQR